MFPFNHLKASLHRPPSLIFLCFPLFLLILPSYPRPFRGPIKWSILLCQFSDSSTPTRTQDFFRSMITTPGTGGLDDYWSSISYGTANLDGSEVKGWYMMSTSSTDAITELSKPDRDRGKYFKECIAAAQNSQSDPYTVPAGNSIAVITDPSVDLWGSPGQAFFPSNIDIGGLSHEIGHGIGLAHSFSDDPNYRNIDWAQIGEYDDPWDIMSYANVFGTWTGDYGSGGPGLNGYHADSLGWIPRDRIFTFGSDGQNSQSLTLAALNHPEASGFLLIRIPFDPSDLRHYYTVEFRKNDGWDAGIGDSIVLIHEIKGPSYVTYLLRDQSGSRAPIQSLSANGVTISVTSVSSRLNQATVSITSDIADRCLQGYVWREADQYDHVCVTPDVRSQAAYDNSQAAFRRSPTGGDFGEDTCIQGYVWREAFTGDHVCVSPDVRSQAWADNEDADNRNNPSRFCYGPNTCKDGYVWREADSYDYVCVSPNVRQQAWDDNDQRAARVNPNGGDFGPDTCIQGYVWREAFVGDHVCVTPDVRSQAWADNNDAPNRWAYA